jgi:hypothetical protein
MYSKHVTILCDGDECHTNTGYLSVSTATEAREQLKERGWTYKNGKDYCPDCADDY